MGFQEVISLDCDNAIQLGGLNRKTNKANPTRLEGYYLGSRDVASPKSKTGFSKLHIFQTAKGTTGVWGKTDLDRKLASAALGVMTRVTFTGMKETKNNPMYVFKVEVDSANSIEVPGADVTAPEAAASYDEAGYAEDAGSYSDDTDESDPGAEEEPLDVAPPVRAAPPARAAAAPSKANQAAVQRLLGKRA